MMVTSHNDVLLKTAYNYIQKNSDTEFHVCQTEALRSNIHWGASGEFTNAYLYFVSHEFLEWDKVCPIFRKHPSKFDELIFFENISYEGGSEKLLRLIYDNVFEIAYRFGLKQCFGLKSNNKLDAYKVFPPKVGDDHGVKPLKNRHEGDRAFLIGNGPSLTNTPLLPLKNEITFCANRVYLGFRHWGFPFKYWAMIDYNGIDHFIDEIKMLPGSIIKFLPSAYSDNYQLKNTFYLNMNYPKQSADFLFNADGHRFTYAHSVMYTLFQLAFYMGCDPLILIGMDHNYDIQPNPITGQLEYNSDNSHAFKNYGLKGLKRIPNIEATRDCYQRVKNWADANGRTILNATHTTKLDVFPVIDASILNSLLS